MHFLIRLQVCLVCRAYHMIVALSRHATNANARTSVLFELSKPNHSSHAQNYSSYKCSYFF